MDMMEVRRRVLMGNVVGSKFMTFTTTQSTQYVNEIIDMIQDFVGVDAVAWFAFVDDIDYVLSGGDKPVMVIGGDVNSQKFIRRNDASYGYFRSFSYSTSSRANTPAGTVFKVYVYQTS